MKTRDLYFFSFSGLHIYLFFRLVTLAGHLISMRGFSTKIEFVIALSVLIGITTFLLFQNVAKITHLLILPEKELYPKVVSIVQATTFLLTSILIASLLENFIIFR